VDHEQQPSDMAWTSTPARSSSPSCYRTPADGDDRELLPPPLRCHPVVDHHQNPRSDTTPPTLLWLAAQTYL